jgi:1-acyl-sn-glycerol-3-phosphate acyltransferase
MTRVFDIRGATLAEASNRDTPRSVPRPSPVYFAIGGLSWPVVRFVFRLRATGVEHLPASGGFVLAANHSSNFDPWPLGVPLYPRRWLRFMAKSELFNPVLKPFVAGAGAFPVRRGQRDLEAIATAVTLVREGHVVVMFPEGTRQRKGLRKRFEARPHTGAARIALEAGAPLVPAGIKGTDRLARLGPLRVAYGPPVDLAGLEGEEAPQIATDRLMLEIRRLYEAL